MNNNKAIITSTKYDGSLHYHFDAQTVSITDREFRFYNAPGEWFDCYRGRFVTKSHSLRVFWADRPWNIMVRWHPDWRFEEFYVNIASPAKWDGRVLSWADLDLDVILPAGRDEPILDDEDEFGLHKIKWDYPDDLVTQCWRSVEEVWSLMKSRSAPFDQAITNWRP